MAQLEVDTWVTKQMEVTFGIFNKEWRVELSVSGAQSSMMPGIIL